MECWRCGNRCSWIWEPRRWYSRPCKSRSVMAGSVLSLSKYFRRSFLRVPYQRCWSCWGHVNTWKSSTGASHDWHRPGYWLGHILTQVFPLEARDGKIEPWMCGVQSEKLVTAISWLCQSMLLTIVHLVYMYHFRLAVQQMSQIIYAWRLQCGLSQQGYHWPWECWHRSVAKRTGVHLPERLLWCWAELPVAGILSLFHHQLMWLIMRFGSSLKLVWMAWKLEDIPAGSQCLIGKHGMGSGLDAVTWSTNALWSKYSLTCELFMSKFSSIRSEYIVKDSTQPRHFHPEDWPWNVYFNCRLFETKHSSQWLDPNSFCRSSRDTWPSINHQLIAIEKQMRLFPIRFDRGHQSSGWERNQQLITQNKLLKVQSTKRKD